MKHQSRPSSPSPEQSHEGLSQITTTPLSAFRRAAAQGQDSAYSLFTSVEDSQCAIALAVAEAMTKHQIGTYRLHELTGLSCDYIEAILEAQADLHDSEPISQLEQALQVQLNHL
jgi:hypothetical protein